MLFQLKSDYQPTGDQPQAISQLTYGLENNVKHQVLLGVTGSGKTFTMANVIKNVQKPTLVISHNKTLAAQLYQELRDFFPDNAVSYFVSYYDYYQPEAYIPSTDTYIEKETEVNEEIDKLRLSATTNLLTRKDVIVIASVSCIYNLGSPVEYGKFVLELKTGMKIKRTQIMSRLIDLQYERSDYEFRRGSFRVKGDTVDVYPAYQDNGLRLEFLNDKLEKMYWFEPLTGNSVKNTDYAVQNNAFSTVIYPAKHYMTDPKSYEEVFKQILFDTQKRQEEFKKAGKLIEAQRIGQKVQYDLEMIREIGYVNGIENYSRYFENRKPGLPPYTLLDYFPKDFLLFIDESHMTIPQIRGMYNGDRSRKQTLIDYGFRLPSALDNRPLKFEEFLAKINQTIYVSATPDSWEIQQSKQSAQNAEQLNYAYPHSKVDKEKHYLGLAQQLIRPTGIPDPEIFVRPSRGQIEDLIKELEERVKRHERTLITTLTKRMAEELSFYLEEKNFKVHYLHSDIATLERSDILKNLRLGQYDVIVGINLLREGLDLPEVSLVVILDADKEGFLRSEVSLIQTMGRAARNVNAKVIMYADNITGSIKRAINEVERRRNIQIMYNRKNHITPHQVVKPVRKDLVEQMKKLETKKWENIDQSQLLPEDKRKLIKTLSGLMKQAASDLDFEMAAKIRDKINQLKQ